MSTPRQDRDRYVALSGGVGGAKLSLGLAQLLGERLTVIVNTGDDFEHLGLHISPDVDTAIYTLAGVVNPETGWGRRDETWTFMAALQQLGGPAGSSSAMRTSPPTSSARGACAPARR